MKAETIDVLTERGQLATVEAIAIAEAIDMAIRDANLVTVSVLDARFLASEAKMDARFAEAEAKMGARFLAAEFAVNARFAAVDARFDALEAKMDARFAAMDFKIDARFTTFESRLEQKFDRLRLQLIIAVIVGSAAMGPLGTAAVEALKRAF
jgi:hypothetical protein